MINVKNSSNIKSIDYQDNNLIVEYLGGSKYKYNKVPKVLYEDLEKANEAGLSIGSFVNQNIKNYFSFEKLEQ